MNKAFVSKKRYNFLFIIIVAIFLVILVRLFYLHIWNQAKLQRVVEGNRQKFEVLEARRGNIVDVRGKLLATTECRVELGIDPQIAQEEDREKWLDLAGLIDVDVAFIEQKVEERIRSVRGEQGNEVRLVRWQKLVEAIDVETYEKVLKLNIKGVYGNRKYKRVYPGGALAAHAIGYVNKEDVAVLGVEEYMNFYLRGQDGWRESEHDGKKNELARFREREVCPSEGCHVRLTLDSVVQYTIEHELEKIVENYNPTSATIIVSEPSTGYLLGLANYPSYDPNTFWNYDIDAHRNRAVTDVFEPGSPFKIVTASAVLNESLVDLEDTYDCSLDRVEYSGRVVRLPKDHQPFDRLSVRDIIKKSSNRGIAQLAMLLGDHKFNSYIQNFGFGERTGYGPRGEVSGIVHKVRDWDGLTISRLPMGHAIGSTPMQLHCAMSVIANQGVLMEPQVVKNIYNDEGETLIDYKPRAKRRVISSEAAGTVANLLEAVVGPEGTSKRASIRGFHAAGKSGTTQKIVDGYYSKRHHVATFSGFFPANSPRLVITIVIDEAQMERVAYGGAVAAPSFRSIGENLIQYLGINPNLNSNCMLALKGY